MMLFNVGTSLFGWGLQFEYEGIVGWDGSVWVILNFLCIYFIIVSVSWFGCVRWLT